MNYKEFYFWMEGFMTNRDWTVMREIDIKTIQDKINEVKENDPIKIGQPNTTQFPLPINPFPVKDDPYKPPFEVYCGTKEQLND